jgi:ABC-type lipoprotein release transport system permease subunit
MPSHVGSKLFVDLTIAFRNLVQHRRRTLFLGLAIAAVTALLVLLNGLTTGVRETMIDTATTLSTGHVNVGGFYKVTAGQAAPVVTDYKKVLEVVKKAVPEMTFAVQRGRGWAKVVSDTGSMQLGITGIDIKTEPKVAQALQLMSGNLNDLAQPGTMLLFDNQAEKLGVKVGDAITISAPTTRGTNNTIDVRVVAIAHSLGMLSSWNAFIPIDSLRALYQLNQESTGVIQIMLDRKGFDHLPEISARLRQVLEQAGYRVMEPDPRAFWMKFQSVSREDWTGQKLDVTSWEDEISFMSWTLTALKGLSVVLIVILIAIIIIGIMNTMWIAIRERTREIGTLRAIGMQRREVLWMFLLESIMLGFGSTIAGAIAGASIAAGLNAAHVPVPTGLQFFLMSPFLHLSVHGSLLVFAVVLITIVTAVAAFYPSIKAARLQPVVAMSHFG